MDGAYTFADGGEQRHARLYFSNGKLQQVFGFTGEEATGAPREITPQRGDTFTILEEWSDLDAEGNVTQVVRQEGETLTFGDEMFTWQLLRNWLLTSDRWSVYNNSERQSLLWSCKCQKASPLPKKSLTAGGTPSLLPR